MNNMHLRSVDLNLLTVFNAIYDYGRLTRAADALGMTQPAVSHALKRLRALFDDALFVRTRARMEPTPRAHAMAGPIAEILQNVRKVLEPGAHNRICATDRILRDVSGARPQNRLPAYRKRPGGATDR